LGVVTVAWIYDYAGARPGLEAAYKKVGAFVDTHNRLGADEAALITRSDIHNALGRQPTWVDKHADDQYEVEYYCWWGSVPLLNMRRHFLAIVYAGNGEQVVFSSHHLNRRPPREALPMPFVEKRPSAIVDSNFGKLPQKDRPLLRRPIAAAWIETGKLLAIANQQSGSLSIVDFPKHQVIDEIVIGQRLADLVAHPSGQLLFAVDPQKNELIILACAADPVRIADRRPVGIYPVSVAVSPTGQCLTVASLWSRTLTVFQCSGDGDSSDLKQLADISLPFNPREHEFSADNIVLVNDAFTQRSCELNITTQVITILGSKAVASPDPSRKLIRGIAAWSKIHGDRERIVGDDFAIALGPLPKLTAEDRGEDLFVSRQLSTDGQSCHDCHPFGHTTFELADTPADGTTGTPKRILTLLGTHQTYPWAWNGAISELDDQVLRSLETTLHVRKVTPQQVIDINSFLHTLSPPPPLEPATDAPDDRAQLLRGQSLFESLGCIKCHVPAFSYTSGEVFDVGFTDEKGLNKFNPPSLLGASQGYSFFHDGRAKTLAEIFTGHGHQLHRELSNTELTDLLRFLRSL
jgi:hypothetical protein